MTTNSVATDTTGDTDAILRVLADGRRRAILRSLEDAPGTEHSVGWLTDVIFERLDRLEPTERPSKQTISTELYHTHLPALEEMELLVHDRDDDLVWMEADESTLELLDLIEEYETTL